MPFNDTTDTSEILDDSSSAGIAGAEAAGSEPPEPTEPPEPGGVDAFDWDNWEGSHETFPEDVRPWAERLAARKAEEYEKALQEQKAIAEKYENWWRQSNIFEADPEKQEMAQRLQAIEAEKVEYEQRIAAMEQEYEAAAERENTAYFTAVSELYAPEMEKLKKDDAAFSAISGALEHDVSLHKMLKLYREGHMEQLPIVVGLVQKGIEEESAWEAVAPLIQAKQKYSAGGGAKAAAPAPQQAPKPKPRAAAAVVEGSAAGGSRTAPRRKSLAEMGVKEAEAAAVEQAWAEVMRR